MCGNSNIGVRKLKVPSRNLHDVTEEKRQLEWSVAVIEPRTSRMWNERYTNWATAPWSFCSVLLIVD